MSLIDLGKKVEIVLQKRGVQNIKARVGFAIDVSGSMQDEFQSGLMDGVTQRVFALAMKFDDNASMDCWTFDNNMGELPEATTANIDGYVRRHIMENASISKWHGTEYAPPLAAAINKWFPAARAEQRVGGFFGFGGKKIAGISEAESASLAKQPSVLVFLTDGDNQDAAAAERALREAQSKPLYINFVGIGTDTDFAWIKRMGDQYPNVGFLSVRNIRSISDDALYEGLVSEELATWLKSTTA